MVRPEVKKKQRQLAEAAAQSRKAKKKLEKVVLRKKLKVNRSNVLAELKKVQLQPEQFDRLHSTASMQTKGLKRFASGDAEAGTRPRLSSIERAEQCLDAAALISKKRRKIKRPSSKSSSSSEDTDQFSTDTEEYYQIEDHQSVKDAMCTTPATTSKTSDCPPDAKNGEKKHPQHSSSPEREPSLPAISCDGATKDMPISVESQPKNVSPAVYVPVSRKPEVDKSRLELPIIGEEQRIMECIRYNDVVILSGETGSGKTTQVPQFLYEAGYTLNGKLIGITEPRRVAAVSMSERVAHEINLTSDEVSYQIRFSGNASAKTKIKFMTDGVLLRECQQDFLLSKYSALIIDEAHERSVFSDILIGLLSRIVPLRAKKGNPLKLVIMSATLRLKDFTDNTFLFPKTPPVINIEARQYPVTVQFAKKTPPEYLHAAYKKVCSIHNKMPRGGILVFVTSQMDVRVLCQRLRKKPLLHCLGLYAMLPLAKQQLVFKEPPEGSRLCVIATNVAETSITIPNIKYVVDTGLQKKKIYDLLTGVSRFITTWTSKSSAEQRTGRAGRMGPGYCYRLYSSAVFTNDFSDYSEPQILQRPVDDVLLQMKAMNIDNVVNFPFPTRPSVDALIAAEKKLIGLGALDDTKLKHARFDDVNKTEYSSRPTALGRAMANYPLGPRCSKMLVLAPKEILTHVLYLVSALTVREMFIDGNKWKELRKRWAGHGGTRLLGDFMTMLRAVHEADLVEYSNKKCTMKGLRTKAMLEIDKLRHQLNKDINSNREISLTPERIERPTDAHSKILRQLILSSFCDHVARKLPDGELKVKKSGDPNIVEKKRSKHAYECMATEDLVYISTESVLKGKDPEWIVFKELYEAGNRTYMRDVAAIEPEWLPFYADKLCTFSDKTDLSSVPPRYDKEIDQILCTKVTTYGTLNWPLGAVEVPMHIVETSGVEIYKHFATFLLSGEVLDWFKKYVDKLLSPPAIMTKPWSKLQPRTNKILQVLVTANIKTKKDLLKAWDMDSSFLRPEYLAWLPEAMHSQVRQDWDQLLKYH